MHRKFDLNKSVIGVVGVNEQWYHVQYEGLHVIYTKGDCYGHVLKDCDAVITTLPPAKGNSAVGTGTEHVTPNLAREQGSGKHCGE